MASEGKKLSLTLIVSLVVAALLLAGGVSYFIATKYVASQGNFASAQGKDNGVLVKVGDPKEGLIVNVGAPNSGRYLKIGVVLQLRPGSAAAKEGNALSPEEVKILDTVVYTLRSRTVEELAPANQEQLKGLIKQEVNKTLGDNRVTNVYFTYFLLQ